MKDYVIVQPDGSWLFGFKYDGQSILIFGQSHAIAQGETAYDAAKRIMPEHGGVQLSNCTARKMELEEGEYFPRMARVSTGRPLTEWAKAPGSASLENELASLRGQLVNLMRSLQDICQTVHPTAATFGTFGHEIRNLLILACTEVETHWRAVLIANGVANARFTTKDYVRLSAPMRLAEYAVALPYYPWLAARKPFANWQASGSPSQDIPWYDAYNKVKHDREQNFAEAQLVFAIDAVCACAIMLCAQFGQSEAFRWRIEFGYFFQFTETPEWRPEQYYIEPTGPHIVVAGRHHAL